MTGRPAFPALKDRQLPDHEFAQPSEDAERFHRFRHGMRRLVVDDRDQPDEELDS
jgi:hypothetical protein